MTRSAVICIFVLFLAACSGQQKPPAAHTAAALKADETPVSSSFQSRSQDIVEALWKEHLERTPRLKALVDKIEALQEQAQDSLLAFARFDEKNRDYYHTAERKASNISDSLLRQRALEILAHSQKVYEQRITAHKALERQLEQKQLQAQNQAAYLKIVSTLAMLQQYQAQDLPRTGAVSEVNKQYDQLVQQLGDMKKQYD